VRLTPVIYEGEIHRGREEVYWRIVRPEHPEDVGGLHADGWYLDHFRDEQGPLIAEDEETLKCWIPLECEPGANGLAVVPDSHKQCWGTITECATTLSRPKISIPQPPPSTLLNTPPGNVVLFGDGLLHEGVVNHGTRDRISCEITLVLRKAA
jgi:ectoine hydroxylase-related dioxygenase (phytanoyl-CoA dioxygenase family)